MRKVAIEILLSMIAYTSSTLIIQKMSVFCHINDCYDYNNK